MNMELFTAFPPGLGADKVYPFPALEEGPDQIDGWDGSRQLGRDSVAATGLDYHVALPAQDDIIVSVIVEQRNGTQLSGHTAHLGDDIWLHQMDLAGRDASRHMSLMVPVPTHYLSSAFDSP